LISNKEHLSQEGLHKIVAIKASINLGLSVVLKAAFPNITPVSRPVLVNQEIKDPYWLAGFVSGEGCFFISIFKSSSNKSGFAVKLKFSLTQHFRDEKLLKSLVDYFGCGYHFSSSGYNYGEFRVEKLSDISDKIIPFFDKYPILGVKSTDYADFKRVAELMKNKAHLIAEGLDQIRQIKGGMNTGRKHS
jgi:hypothetical protein